MAGRCMDKRTSVSWSPAFTTPSAVTVIDQELSFPVFFFFPSVTSSFQVPFRLLR